MPASIRSAAISIARPPPPARRCSAVPGDPGFGTVHQGYLENSNVDPVKEITELISAQRAYEMNSKVIQAADEMFGDRFEGHALEPCAAFRGNDGHCGSRRSLAALGLRVRRRGWQVRHRAGAAGAEGRRSIPATSSPTSSSRRAPSSPTPWHAPTILEAREALIGKVARRTLLPGQPIPVSAIRDPYLVTQGKTARGRCSSTAA